MEVYSKLNIAVVAALEEAQRIAAVSTIDKLIVHLGNNIDDDVKDLINAFKQSIATSVPDTVPDTEKKTKKKRDATAYNHFIKNAISGMKDLDLDSKEKMRRANIAWNEEKAKEKSSDSSSVSGQ